MSGGWVDKIGEYRVERKEGPRPGGQDYLRLRPRPSFCVHTTEGSSVEGAVSTLRGRYSAPHFVVGEGRIVQMRPVWAQAATLVNHNDRFLQVECVGHASLREHQLTEGTWKPLVALTRWVHRSRGVPLVRPAGWDDDLGGGTWADNNVRRKSRKALEIAGVFGHIDVPDQDPTWHWDPGSLDYSELFAQARGGLQDTEDDVAYLKFKEGARKYIERTQKRGEDAGKAPEAMEDKDQRFGWKLARFAYKNGENLFEDEPA